MTDTPRDPLAARPLTQSEIARLRSYLTDPKAYRTRVRSIEARQWIAGLLATLDTTRPSGDEALRAAALGAAKMLCAEFDADSFDEPHVCAARELRAALAAAPTPEPQP